MNLNAGLTFHDQHQKVRNNKSQLRIRLAQHPISQEFLAYSKAAKITSKFFKASKNSNFFFFFFFFFDPFTELLPTDTDSLT